MPSLPSISGREAVRTFEKAGFVVRRQRGSHIIMRKPGASSISVPNHRTVKAGTLHDLIRQAGLTVEEFIALL
jgi:predicted RNA binding protein YcfA (HicA-like mRNA interferase family)